MSARPASEGRVAALVLTWNSADLIERCLDSLLAQSPPVHIAVVDNASADETVALVRDGYPQVQVIETGANLGFAGGCNTGIAELLEADFEHVFLLNPDAYAEADCVDALTRHLDEHVRCAAASPLIRDHPSGVVWFGGSDIDWATGTTYHRGQGDAVGAFGTTPFPTQRMNGGAVLLRSSALREVDLFDEAYFLYYEETDLSVRLARAGWGLDVVPGARAWHEASSSTGGNLGPVYNYYLTRGRLRFLRKFGASRVRWVPVFLHLARETRWLTKTFGTRRTMPAVLARIRAVVDFARRTEGPVSI